MDSDTMYCACAITLSLMRDLGVSGRLWPSPCPDDDEAITEARASKEGLPLPLVAGLTTADDDDDDAATARLSLFPPFTLWLWLLVVLTELSALLPLLLFSLGDSG